jgi:hypothetical protein
MRVQCHGSFVFRENATNKDNCYVKRYNKGGVPWNEGLPHDPPPAAEGVALAFADDFDRPLSISSTDTNAPAPWACISSWLQERMPGTF